MGWRPRPAGRRDSGRGSPPFAPILISLSFKVVSDQCLIGSGVASACAGNCRGCRRAHEAGAAPRWRRTFGTTVAPLPSLIHCPGPRFVFTERHAAHLQINGQFLLVDGEQRQIHSLDIAFPDWPSRVGPCQRCARSAWCERLRRRHWAAVRTKPSPKYTPRPGPHDCGGSCQMSTA